MDFQKIFSHIPEAIVVLSPDLKILTATDAYQRVTMRSLEELVGKDFLNTFPDNPEAVESKNEKLLRQSLERVLQSKKPDYLDVLRYDIPRPEVQGGGFEVRYWEAIHAPVLDDAGNVEAIIQRTTDVTERELAKLALSESQEKYRFMAEAMPQLIFTMNSGGKITYLNQRWTRFTGLPVKELIFNGIDQVIHPDDAPAFGERLQDALESNTELQMEIRIKASEGIYRWHLARILPKLDEQGQLVLWVGTISDIHDPKQMVQDLLEANTQMVQLSEHVQVAYNKAEAERMKLERLLMESPAFFCMLKGPEHRYELVNQNYQKIFPGKELLHKTVAEALPEVVNQGIIEILDQVYQTGESYTTERMHIKLDRNGTGDLEDLLISFQYQPLYNEHHQVYGILVFGYELPQADAN